jgi:osmoprotectant transport system permease protein
MSGAPAMAPEVLRATAAHLDLVVEAMAVAVLLGVALGVAASRSAWAERLVLTLANVLQTVPSLALLGFLIVALGGAIGKLPALVALVVYALLPIVKATVVGLRGVEPSTLEAATGMGMTPWQRLRLVELPMAVPVISGGVRVATVAAVGMATIAAFIGAPGLGTYIFRGISLSNPGLILWGAAPAAVLALACDAALGEVERRLDPRRTEAAGWRGRIALALLAILLGVAAWGFWLEHGPRAGRRGTVVVGSKDSAEPILLGHMLADLIEAHTDLAADRRLNLGGTFVCFKALESGGLDVYVEYTGTALTTLLNEPPVRDPAEARRVVAEGLRRRGVRMLDPLGFENTFAILMRREQAQRLGIRRISDLRAHQDTLRPGFGPEFMNRPDGYPGLIETYQLDFANPPREMDRNLLYEAVARGTIDVAAGDSTDGRIDALGLVVLEDDRRYFPPYEAVPLAREATLAKSPELAGALDRLAGRIDAATMRRLNAEVDRDKRDPRAVAREFLTSEGLLSR